jgi:hypothetical protein
MKAKLSQPKRKTRPKRKEEITKCRKRKTSTKNGKKTRKPLNAQTKS